jgi:hypothetical protein
MEHLVKCYADTDTAIASNMKQEGSKYYNGRGSGVNRALDGSTYPG